MSRTFVVVTQDAKYGLALRKRKLDMTTPIKRGLALKNMNEVLPLRELYIEITNSCPQNCLFCSSNSGLPYHHELSRQQMLQLLKDAEEIGLERLYITGGEPLEDTIKTQMVIESAYDLGINAIYLLTNGQRLDQEWSSYLRNFKDKLSVEMTVLSTESKIHDFLVDYHGSLSQVLRATGYCVGEGLDVVWEFVVTKHNKNHIEPVIRLAEEFNVHKLSIMRLMLSGRAMENRKTLELPHQELYDFLMGLDNLNHRVEIQIGAPVDFRFLRSESLPPSCSAGIKKLLVQADGNILPCTGFKSLPDFICGNIEFQSLDEIWFNSPILHELRKFHNDDTTVCSECPFSLTCKGHCTAQRLHYYNDLYKGPDPLCPAQKSEVDCMMSMCES
jgi:radical SAM protein with 4Fe4S-binding SPASM domain